MYLKMEWILFRKLLNLDWKYSFKIEETVKCNKRGVSYLSTLVIQFGVGLESLGRMTCKLLEKKCWIVIKNIYVTYKRQQHVIKIHVIYLYHLDIQFGTSLELVSHIIFKLLKRMPNFANKYSY